MKEWLIYLAGIVCIIFSCLTIGKIIDASEAKAQSKASAPAERAWRVGSSTVNRIYDTDTGTICYVVPQEWCSGNCAYSPAISCVRP